MLQQIELSKLYPHPDNPRKEVGDVTELAQSIKQNGVFQNLTVVTGGKGVPKGADGFTVIIGHRRLAASKIAGLKELPCSVVEMSETKQVETMLLENMQRSDLTVYEQAQGFQMLLDLGETQQSIAEKTGFSPATVSRRIKLLQIKSAAFEKTQGKNITLDDYLKIAELKSKSAQKEALEAAGTNNFNYVIKRLIEEQFNDEVRPKVIKELQDLGAKELKEYSYTWNGKYQSLKSVAFEKYAPGCLGRGLKKEPELFYYLYTNQVNLYKKRPQVKQTKPKKSPEEVSADQRREELKAITKRMYELRRDFILGFGAAKKNADIVLEWIIMTLAKQHNSNYYGKTFATELIDKVTGGEKGSPYYIDEEKFLKYYETEPDRAALITAYSCSGDNADERYYSSNWGQRFPEHSKNEKLDMIYAFLGKLGYEMSDEEKQLQNGTHPLFQKGMKE